MARTLDLDRDHVAVCDDVVAPSMRSRPLSRAGRVAAALDQLLPADRLGFDEGVLDLGVDRAGRLPGGGAAPQRRATASLSSPAVKNVISSSSS
jgi:hypothetical protein